MVLSQILTPLLTKVLGDYLKPECFQEDTLRVGLWRGHVELFNVFFKEDVLDPLGLPLTLRFGRIGHMEVQIPWNQLGRKAMIVKLEQVHVLAYAKYQWEDEANERRLEAIKQAQLRVAEEKAEERSRDLGPTSKEAAAALAASGAGAGTGTHWLLHRLLNRVLDRLQIEIRDVHIRFEDMVSSPNLPYCLGLTLEDFQVTRQDSARVGQALRPLSRNFLLHGNTNTNTNARQRGMEAAGERGSSEGVLKVARIECLSLYCNPVNNDDLVSMALHELEKDEEVDVMLGQLLPRAPSGQVPGGRVKGGSAAEVGRKRGGESGGGGEEEGQSEELDRRLRLEQQEEEDARRLGGHCFLLHPVRSSSYFWLGSMEAGSSQMTRVMRGLLGLETITVTLEDHLLRSLLSLSAGLVRFQTMNRLGVRRPRKGVMEDPRAWWRYAYTVATCKLHEHRGKYDWGMVLRRRRDRLRYVKYWKRWCRVERRLKTEEEEEGEEEGGAEEVGEKSEREDREGEQWQDERETLSRKIKKLEGRLSYGDILLYRKLAEAQLKADGVELQSPPVRGRAQWWKLLRAADSDSLDPAVLSVPVYAAMVVQVEATLQQGEVRLASRGTGGGCEEAGMGSSVEGGQGRRRDDFLRVVIKDLVLRARGDSMKGLQWSDASLDDARIESLASPSPAHADMPPGAPPRASPGQGAGYEEDADSLLGYAGSDGVQEGGNAWCRLVSRRIRPLGPSHASHFSPPKPLFRMTYTLLPTGSPFLADIRLTVEEIEAILVPTAPWLQSIHRFFDLPDTADSWVDLEMVALSNLTGLREQLDAKLEYLVHTRPEVRMRLHVKGPLLMVLPPADEPLAPAVHLELDSVSITSKDRTGGIEAGRGLGGGAGIWSVQQGRKYPGEADDENETGKGGGLEPGGGVGSPPPPLNLLRLGASWQSVRGLSDGRGLSLCSQAAEDVGGEEHEEKGLGSGMRWRSPSKPFDSVLPPSFRREQSYCPGSSLGSVETTEITSRRDYDRLYDRLEVSVLGVRLGLMPARGLRVVPLLDPLAVMASVALSRLPSDPQMPRLQLTVSTGEINLKLSSEMLKQVTRLGVACLRTSQKTNQDFEQLRQRFELMARKGTSMTRLSSYLNFSAEGMFGRREEEDMLPVRLSAGGCGDLTEGGTAERGSSSLFPAGSERADVSPLPDFYDARSIASLGSSTSSRRSPSMGRVPASNERDQEDHDRVGIAEDGEESGGVSTGPRKTAWRGPESSAGKSSAHHPTEENGGNRGEEGYHEESEDGREVGEEVEEEEEFFDTQEGYRSDDEAFRHAFGSNALTFLHENESGGRSMVHLLDDRTGQCPPKSPERASSSVYKVVKEAMQQQQSHEQGGQPTAYTYKNWRILRAEFSLPRLQVSLWAPGSSLEVHEAETFKEIEERCLMTVWAVGFGVRYTAESFLHRLRVRLEDLTVSCRGAPPEMPLFRLGIPLPLPTFLPDLTTGTKHGSRNSMSRQQVPNRQYHPYSAVRSTSTLLSFSPPESTFPSPAGHSTFTGTSHLKPPFSADFDPPKTDGEPFRLLFQLVRDPDSAVTGRLFRSLQGSLHIAALASHLDQETVAEILRALAPLKTLMALSGDSDANNGSTPSVNGAAKAFRQATSAASDFSSSDKAGTPSSSSLNAFSSSSPSAQNISPPSTCGAESGQSNALPLSETREQAPHIHLTLQAHGARLALVRGPQVDLLLAIGPTTFDIKPEAGGAVLACSLRVMELELQAMERETRYPHRILSHPPHAMQPVVAVTASVSTSLVLPPLRPYLAQTVAKEQRFLNVDTQVRGLSAFFPAKSMILLGQDVLKGPVIPYLAGSMDRTGACSRKADGATPFVPSSPSSSRESGVEPDQSISEAVSQDGAVSGYTLGKSDVTANLHLVQSSVWLPLQDGEYGAWQDALVLKVEEFLGSYHTAPGDVASTIGVANVSSENEECSLVVKGARLEQSGEEGTTSILALEAADACMRQKPQNVHLELKLGQLSGEIEAASLLFLLALQGHMQDVFDREWCALLTSPHAFVIFGRPSPPSLPHSRTPPALVPASAPPSFSPASLSTGSPPVTWTASEFNLGVKRSLSASLHSDGLHVTFHVGIHSIETTRSMSGRQSPLVLSGASARSQHAALILVVEELRGQLVFQGSGCVEGSTVEAAIGQVMLLHEKDHRGAETFAELVGLAKSVSRQDRDAWEAIRLSSSTTGPSRLFPEAALGEALLPHVWVRGGVKGDEQVAAEMGLYFHPTDWTLSLPGLEVVHSVASIFTQALGVQAAEPEDDLVGSEPIVDPLPHLRSSQSCSGDGRDSSAEGFFARLQSLSEGTLEENDEVIQLKLRQLLGDMTCKWPVLFASLHMEMAIGTQQVSVVESSSSSSSSVPTSSLFPSGREGMTQTEALVFQASMGIGASIIPTYSEGNTAGRGQVVKHVAGHVTAAGRGWQLMTKRISAPSPSAHFSSWASLSSRPSRGCSVLVRDESGDMHRMPSYVEAEQHVLSPFEWELSADCNLDLSLTSPEPVIAAGVSFCVDPLEAWTFLDTRDMQHLISSTLVPVMALFNPPSPSVGEKTGDFVLDSKFQLHLVEKLPIADDNGDSRSVAWTGVPPSLKLLDYAKIRVAVSVQSARMTVINNLNRSAIPLMNVTLDGPLSLDMGATDGVVEATLRVGMRAKYFNRRLVIWEPLLEPWTVQASVMTGYIPASLDASCVIADMPNRPLLGPAAIAPPASPNYGLRKMHSFGSPRRIVSSLREKAPDFLSHSQRKRKRYFASFRATSTQVANFNITEPFLDNVMNANIGLAKADARRQILARQDSEAKAHSSEVRSVRTSDVGSKGLGEGPGEGAALHFNFVRNDTGVLLRYHASSIDVWHEVSPGTQEPLLLPPPRGGRSGSDGLQLELQRAGQHAWSALAHVDADMEGVREYSIPTLDGALRIVCEVSRVGGVKLLRIRSTELFENNCSFPLHVALKAGYGVVQWESKLTPGSQVPLPIYLAELEESSLLLSVADETEQGKVSEEPRLILEVPMPLCTADIDANESNSGGESAPSLPSAILNLADNHAAAPLNIVMGPSHNQNFVDASNSDKEMHLPGAHPSRSCGPSRTIRFSPPFLVRNALPVPMEILLRVQEEPKQGINKVWMSRLSKEDLNDANDMSLSKRFAALEIVRLRPGESCSWYGASGERNVLLWLRLPGFNWNKAKVIPSSSAMQNANMHANALEVELEDERSSQVLDVSVEVTLHELIAQQLVIYVPYWIVNITDLPLEYAHDVWDFSSDRARLGMQEGLLAGQTAKKVESGSSSWHGIRVPKEIPPYSMGRKHHQKHGPHGLGLRALLPPPASEAERLLARAKGQIVMAGYTSTASSPGMTRLSMRLYEEKSRLPGAWSRGFALPPATEGLVGFFELRTQPRPAGWASRLGPFHRGRRSARRDAVVTGGNGSSQAARRGGQQAAVPALSWGFGLSVSQHAAGGAFHRTRVVTVAPKFLLINSFGRALEVKQNGTIEDSSVPAVNLPCHGTQSVPFYWTVRTGSRYLRVRLCEFGWEWSGRFVPDVPGDVTLALRHVHVEAKCLLQVRITLEDASYVIRFRREPPSFAPYRIENRTLGSVWFVQAGLGNGGMDSEREPEVLLPYHACTFSWDEPLLDHSLELEWQAGEGGLRREYLGSFSFNPDIPIRPPAKGISVMVETRGPIRVMILTAFPLRSSSSLPPPAFGPREIDRMPGRGTEGDGRLASHTADLSVYSWVVDLEVDLRGLGISLLNGLPQELLYVSAQDLRGRWDMRWPCSRLRLTVGHLQVDDQMVNTSCPVVFVGEESKKKSGVVEGSLEAYGGRKIYGGDGLQRANALIYPSTEAGVVARGAWTNADDARVLVREGQRQSPQGLHLWPVALPHLDITVEQDLMYERILFFQAMRVKMTPYHVRLDGNLVAALLNLFSRVLTSVSEDMKEILSAKGYASYVRPAFNYDLGLMEKVSAAISPSTILSPVEHILRDTVLRGPYSQEKESISPEVAEVALHRRWDSNGGVERGIDSEQICRTESGRPLVIEEDAYKVFVDYLAVDPVRIQVSFTASSMVSRVLSHLVASGPSGERFRAMKLLLDVVGSALSKVDNAPIRFSPLILRHAFSADLVKKGVAHYASQALRQAYILLGTLDVLGNPARILANISAGLRDFIYEPAKGLGQGNLWQFSMGLYRGSASLAVRVVLSLLDGIQSLASSLHAGILPLAGLIEDDSLLNARRVPTPLSRTISPISTGMSTSSIEIPHRMEGSVGGLLRGLGALVYEPIRGARRGGVRGLRAGIARGIVSVVLRPTRGFLEDVVGVCRAGRMYLQPHIARLDGQSRVRAPRLFKTRDAPLTLYSPELSMAQDMLRRVEQGSHWNEGLIFYRFFPGMTRCILLTAKHLLVVSVASPGSPGTYTLEWGLSLASLVQVDTLPPSDVLLHVISSSAEGYHPDHSSSLQQPPQGLALPSVPRSPPTDALGTSPESTDVASSLPSSGPETGRVRRNSSLGGGSTGILQHLGTWMRHSFSSQRPDLGLHTKEQLLELPDKEAVQGLIQGLRALGEYPHANYHIRVLPYFNDSDAQSLLDS